MNISTTEQQDFDKKVQDATRRLAPVALERDAATAEVEAARAGLAVGRNDEAAVEAAISRQSAASEAVAAIDNEVADIRAAAAKREKDEALRRHKIDGIAKEFKLSVSLAAPLFDPSLDSDEKIRARASALARNHGTAPAMSLASGETPSVPANAEPAAAKGMKAKKQYAWQSQGDVPW